MEAFWEFDGRIYVPRAPQEINADSIQLIGHKARKALLQDVLYQLDTEAYKKDNFFQMPSIDRIQLQNGVLEISSLELKPHDKKHRARRLLPVAYDPDAECPRFCEAVDEWLPDPECARLYVEYMGLLLVPDTSFHASLWMLGEGANGKSEAIWVCETLLGRENIAAVPLSALKGDRTFPAAGLDGVLLNATPELEAHDKIDLGFLKSLLTDDFLTVERKGEKQFDMTLVTCFIFQSNNPPRLSDRSDGIWRRMMPLRFPRTFLPHEVDKNLRKTLLREMPGILNLAVKGLRALRARGHFAIPQAVVDERADYKLSCNPLAGWKKDRLMEAEVDREGKPARLKGADAYANYQEWCRQNGLKPFSHPKFTRELKRLGVESKPYKDGGRTHRGFAGFVLIEGWMSAPPSTGGEGESERMPF